MLDVIDSEDIAGITDQAWWDWFNNKYSAVDDPWRNWLAAARFPREGPLHGHSENDIKDAITATDALRLTTTPTTNTFAPQWATFRRQHCELDESSKYRRRRYMVWRGAALTSLCQQDRFQDVVDAGEAHDKLAYTMRWFGPVDADGDFRGGNFWQVTKSPDPLTQYAAMVLLLTRQALTGSNARD
jgi:hypothetical protein